MQQRCRVVEDHIDLPSGILCLKAGERASFARRPTEWKGWLFCTNSRGEQGWVPESWLALEGNTCTALRDYDSTELGVKQGEVVTVELLESGWALVVNSRGEKGWIPARCIERLDPKATHDETG